MARPIPKSARSFPPVAPAAPAAPFATSLERVGDYFLGRFAAMASPCEVLVDTDDRAEAEECLRIAEGEAKRIESAFSRYRSGNIVHRINNAQGLPVRVDDETAHLLDYAAACWESSDGLFDITSGALRRVWKFDGGDRVPTDDAIRDVLRHVGWRRVTWDAPTLTMPAGMEIDFGGIGKEYAVDRAAVLIAARTERAFLVNFGGDLFASGARRGNRPWAVGVDDPERTGEAALYRVEIARGGLATSGDARRFVMWNGKRLGHILNPKTGWPVGGAPRAVTVVAATCMEAGTLSTLAYLQGAGARAFLEDLGVEFRLV
ncbi:MAG TPA: FAD:protein FMN transferase [Candidatus Eisenbacteria bacterium]|nr:FAD:protein FMN transferase [Candidatus Eisenbacteria bacterium]